MKKKRAYANASITFLTLVSIVSCHNAISADSMLPTANAGPDQVVKVGQYVILDGSGSSRGDGDTLIYGWTADSNNPSYVYVDGRSERSKAAFSAEGIYRFKLVVNDGLRDSDPDEVTVTATPRDRVQFEDVNLEISLRYAVSVPSGKITDSMLLTIDTLYNYSGYYKISSLNGIETCENLIVLGMSNQSITDISPIAKLTRLQALYLDQNRRLANIAAIAGLKELRGLNLQMNNISDISPLRNLTKLTFLNLMTNPITDISVLKDMTQLDELWLDSSRLAGTSVISRFAKLRILWMTDCDLTDVAFLSTLTYLHFLHLGGNHVSDISALANCTLLERLYMDRNEVTDITPLEKLTDLNLLDLGQNKITNIKPLVENAGLGHGDAITLTGNPLDSISVNQYIPVLRNRGVIVFY